MTMVRRAALLLALASTALQAQFNAVAQASEASLPFTMTPVGTFNLPWRIAFLPDGRMLITERVGPLWLATISITLCAVAIRAVMLRSCALVGSRLRCLRFRSGCAESCATPAAHSDSRKAASDAFMGNDLQHEYGRCARAISVRCSIPSFATR